MNSIWVKSMCKQILPDPESLWPHLAVSKYELAGWKILWTCPTLWSDQYVKGELSG